MFQGENSTTAMQLIMIFAIISVAMLFVFLGSADPVTNVNIEDGGNITVKKASVKQQVVGVFRRRHVEKAESYEGNDTVKPGFHFEYGVATLEEVDTRDSESFGELLADIKEEDGNDGQEATMQVTEQIPEKTRTDLCAWKIETAKCVASTAAGCGYGTQKVTKTCVCNVRPTTETGCHPFSFQEKIHCTVKCSKSLGKSYLVSL